MGSDYTHVHAASEFPLAKRINTVHGLVCGLHLQGDTTLFTPTPTTLTEPHPNAHVATCVASS